MSNQKNIFETIKRILTEVTGENNDHISIDSPTSSITGWDSITHIEFVVLVEDEFNIKLTSSEMVEFTTIRDILDIIAGKI
jgi:acyl carrier protein